MPTRACTECGERLPENAPAIQKTCSAKCRAKRSRRIKKAQKEGGQQSPYTPEQKAMADAVNGQVRDVAHDVLEQELRPVVREALTEDVLKAVGKMVGLTAVMVEAIEDDIRNGEPDVRQKAYTLLAKYTLGNPSVAPKGAEVQPAPMQVVFNMPRPGDATPSTVTAEVVVETRQCSECEAHKPSDDFVAGSERCQGCHDELQARVAERFA